VDQVRSTGSFLMLRGWASTNTSCHRKLRRKATMYLDQFVTTTLAVAGIVVITMDMGDITTIPVDSVDMDRSTEATTKESTETTMTTVADTEETIRELDS